MSAFHYLFPFILCGFFLNLSGQPIQVPADYPTIQTAINSASAGDTILVAAGIYMENLMIHTSNLVLIGDQKQSIIQDTSSMSETSVVLCDSVADVLITGFTIRDGDFGIRMIHSDSIRINHNDIIHNSHNQGGQGIYVQDSSSAIISNNMITKSGIGVNATGGSYIRLIENEIHDCRGSGGGGVNLFGSDGYLRDNYIHFCWDGAINIFGGNVQVIRNRLIDNDGWTKAGGMNITNNAQVVVCNTLIKWATLFAVTGRSAGIYSHGSDVAIYNSVFANNSGFPNFSRGAALGFHNNISSIAKNNIFYANSNGQEVVFLDSIGSQDFSYNTIYSTVPIPAITGLVGGTGNIFVDPQFCNTTEYYLSSNSPCLDSGDPDPAWNDLDGTNNDMGWYGGPKALFQPGDLSITTDYINPGAAMVCDAVTESWGLLSGSCGLIIDSMRLQTGNPFSLLNAPADGTFLQGLSMLEMDVLFQPSTVGMFLDTLYMYSSDTTLVVPMMGLGIECDSGVYYHAFQNFDDDVFRVRTFSNLFGGDNGIFHGSTPQFTTSLDTLNTRTGYGRSLKFNYGPLNHWSMYLESFSRRWVHFGDTRDLTDMFPDYANPSLQNRDIDSIAFHVKLDSTSHDLTLKLELHDQFDVASSYSVQVPASGQWTKFVIGLDQFVGNFDPSKAKFLGFVIADFPGNIGESGVMYLDDIYLVEKGYTKPQFGSDNEYLAYINEINFRHFWTAVDSVSKFALDRHFWRDLISVDAIGFQLSSYVVAKNRGWIDSTAIETRVEHILDFLLNECQHAPDTADVIINPLNYATVNGIWAHFLDNQSLARKDHNTEFSLFSNALLLAGVHVAMQAFPANPNIQAYADSLIRMADWRFLYRPQDSLMNYDWKPNEGFSDYYTDWFSEELDLAFLLAISTPDTAHRLPLNPYFSAGYRKCDCVDCFGHEYIYSAPGANFTYYFLQMYARFPQNSSRFLNTQNALKKDLDYSQFLFSTLNYDPRIYGITACEGPDSAGIDSILGPISNYHAYGYPCKLDEHNRPNGTITVYGSASDILYNPTNALNCLKYYYEELDPFFQQEYGYAFWSPIFGFPDAFHLDPEACTDTSVNILNYNGPWLSVPRFGIDIGPMLMSVDSYLAESQGMESIRDLFSTHPYIQPYLNQFESLESNVDSANCPIFIPPAPPKIIAISGPAAFCQGDSVQLCAPEGYHYLWSNGSTDQCISISTSGAYFAEIIAEDGCTTTLSDTILIMVSELSVYAGADTSICAEQSVLLGGSPTAMGGLGPLNFSWTPTTGLDNSTLPNPTATLFNNTVYTLNVVDSLGCSASDQINISVNQLPSVSLTVPMDTCEDAAAFQLSGGSPAGGIYSGPGVMNGMFDPSIAGLGTHMISYVFTNQNGCTASASASIIVHSLPAVSLTVPMDTCEDAAAFQLSGGSPAGGIYSGPGVINGMFDPSIAGLGTHMISYVFTNQNGCTDSASASIIVYSLPAVSLIVPMDTCEDVTAFQLSGGSPVGGTYTGPGVSNGVFNPSIAGIGTHTVSYVFTNQNGCTDSASASIIVHSLPAVSLTVPMDTCEDAAAFQLSGGSPVGGIYSGPGVINGIFDPSIAGIGTHMISYVFTNQNGCTDSASASIIVYSLPAVSLIVPMDTCEDVTAFQLSGGSPVGGTYTGPGVSNGVFNPSIAGIGTHTVSYVFTNQNGCTDSASASIIVHSLPAVSLTVPMDTCEDAAVFQLSGGSPVGGIYSGPGVINGIFDPSIAGIGTHMISYVFTNQNGCTDSASASIIVHSLPAVSLTVPMDTCEDAAAFQLSGGSPAGGIYSGPGVMNGMFDPSIAGIGTHTISYVFVDGNGCTDSTTSVISILASPDLSLGPDTSVCDSFILDAGNPGASYLWSTGDTTQMLTVDSTGWYTVTVINSQDCEAMDTVWIEVLQTPVAMISDSLDADSVTYHFSTPGIMGANYEWLFGTLGSDSIQNPSFTFDTPGQHTIMLTVSNDCGMAHDSITIFIKDTTDKNDLILNPNQIQVFPNPSTGKFWVVGTDIRAARMHLEISDLTGRIVMQQEIRAVNGLKEELDLTLEANGIYVLHISLDNSMVRRKILKN